MFSTRLLAESRLTSRRRAVRGSLNVFPKLLDPLHEESPLHSRQKRSQTVAVIGLGYVGLPLALLAKKQKFNVMGIDTDSKKIRAIAHGRSPFRDEAIERALAAEGKDGLRATTRFHAVEQAGIVVVCVPTPVTEDHVPDLAPLEQACRSVAPYLRPETLVVIESSIYPGTTETVIKPILEKGSGLSVAAGELFLAHCPERINPGDNHWRVGNLPRVVGGVNRESTEQASAFYRRLLPQGAVKEMSSVAEAEAVKMVENAFRDVNIAFVNELAIAFEKWGINILHVIDGASTKPFAFLPHYPGCGVGGHCIPVDPYYLIERARESQVPLHLIETALAVNNSMPAHTVDLTLQATDRLGLKPAETTVVVLGLAYKADTDDERESPSHEIIHLLETRRFPVVVYDPYLAHPALSAPSLAQALSRSVVVILATAHREFLRALTPEFLVRQGIRAVIDGRNCLRGQEIKKAGIAYQGIGLS